MIGFEHGTLALQASIFTTVSNELVDCVVQRKAAVSNNRGVFSPRNSQNAAFSIKPVALEFNLLDLSFPTRTDFK